MADPVRILNDRGVRELRRCLAALREGGTSPPPRSLLADPATSEPAAHEALVEPRRFPTRLDAASYLLRALESLPAIEEDVGLWSWLSLYYFDEVCPPRPDGTRSPGRDYRHVLEPGYLRGHRHLLAGPFVVYRLHGEKARLLLCTSVPRENKFHHELGARQFLISNPAVIGAADRLYFNARRRAPKRGAQLPEKVPGGLRRFVDVLMQLEVNYDLYAMTPEAILALLPAEFDRWKRRRRFLPFLRRREAGAS